MGSVARVPGLRALCLAFALGAIGCAPAERIVVVEKTTPCPEPRASQATGTPSALPQSCGQMALERAAFDAQGLGERHPRRVAIEAAYAQCEGQGPSPDECAAALREEQVAQSKYGSKHPTLRAVQAKASLCRRALVQGVPAARFAFDGVTLGETVARFIERQNLQAFLCDTDPIQERSRRIWFFAPCRKAQSLPNRTLLTLFSAPSAERESAKVDAVAWAFGDFAAIEFPARIGSSAADVERALGPGTRIFDFEGVVDDGGGIQVVAHGPDVYSIMRQGLSMAFVVGRMGRERDREEWRGLVANFLKAERLAAKAP